MRCFHPAAVAVAALAASSVSARAEGLRATARGIHVTAGRVGYTLGYPVFTDEGGKKSYKPIEVNPEGRRADIRYQDGGRLSIEILDNGEVVMRPRKLPADAKRFKMESHLGFGLAEEGTFSIDGGEARPFPARKPATPMLHQGGAESLTLTTRDGEICTFQMPKFAYLQLQDNREWGWKMFVFYFLAPYDANRDEIRIAIRAGTDAAAAKPKIRVDRLGQYAGADWPLKVRSLEELEADVEKEKEYYASLTPPQLDAYGGLPGSGEKLGLQKTGFFHVEKKGGRWYLVDPAGNVFFHLGVCSFLPYQSDTYVAGREEVYEWLPSRDGEFASAWGDSHGRRKEEFNFHLANMIRKYGEPYEPSAFAERMIRRVRKFGFNSGGAFGGPDATACEELSFPYVSELPLKQWHGIKMIEREVWDPFDEGNRKKAAGRFSRLADRADDPLLIGYFIANEPLYENLPAKVPTLKGGWACKRALVKMLQAKYRTISAFTRAWGVEAASFEELTDRGLPLKTRQAAGDMQEYMELFYETLFRLVTDTARRYDPNHMIMGNRLQYGTINNELLCRISAKYVDVISFNYYTYAVDRAFLDKIYTWTGGKPMILSEFYWDSPSDSGLPGGVKDVNSQEERGLAYRNYVETAAATNYVVGVEWYTLLDTHYTGVGFAKYSGWNANEGLFSVVDRPWRPTTDLMVETNYDIYKVILGEREPFAWNDPRFQVGAQGTKTAKVSRALGEMLVDGKTDNWPGLPAEPIGTDRVVEGGDAGGVEGSFKLCWDDDNLYVLVDVTDPTPMRNSHTGAHIWNGDAIEIFVGSEKLDQGGALLFTDRQILLSAGLVDGRTQYHVRNAPEQHTIRMAVLPRVDGEGHVIEAALPWTALAMRPGMNREFLFDIGIDDGGNGTRRLRQLMWNGTARNSSDRSGWARARLVQ